MAAAGSERMPAVTEVSSSQNQHLSQGQGGCSFSTSTRTSLGVIPAPDCPFHAAKDQCGWPEKQRLVLLPVPWNCAVMLESIWRSHNPDALDPSRDGWVCRLWEVLAALSPGM